MFITCLHCYKKHEIDGTTKHSILALNITFMKCCETQQKCLNLLDLPDVASSILYMNDVLGIIIQNFELYAGRN